MSVVSALSRTLAPNRFAKGLGRCSPRHSGSLLTVHAYARADGSNGLQQVKPKLPVVCTLDALMLETGSD